MVANVESGTGSQAIGFVGAVAGSAIARGEDGIERTLQIGDPVFANDVIITGEVSSIAVDFVDGTRLDLGRESQAVLDSDVFDPASLADTTDVAATAEALQQAILAGKDPSEVFEAPAAGEEEVTDEGGTEPVEIDLTGQQVTPESGFETTGLEFAFPPTEPEIPGPEVEIPPTPEPYIALAGIESDNVLVKEDNSAEVAVSAGTNSGSAMDEIVITGLDGGWGYNLAGLIHDGATATIVGTTLTIDLSGYTGGLTYGGTFTVFPPTDSDVDLGTLSGTLAAYNTTDPTVTGAAGDTVFVGTDAVADAVTVGLSVNDSGDSNSSFQTGETGTVDVSASFGDVGDASETHLVAVTLPDGFTASGLSGTYTQVGQVITWTVSGTNFNTSFSVTNSSAPDGNYTFNALSSAEELNLSGVEPDTGDNLETAATSAAAVVAGVPVTYVTLGEVGADDVVVQEDGTETVSLSAGTSVGSAMDTIVITGLDSGWTYVLSGLTHDGATASISGTTLTIYLSSYTGGLTYDGSFDVSPPADSHVDLGTLSAEISAHNTTDPTVIGTGSDTVDVITDANADMPYGVTIAVNDSGDGNSTFQPGETGTVNLTANFGDVSDGSETHLVTLTLPDGFSATGLSGDYTYVGQVITWTVSGTSFSTSFDVTNDSGSEGSNTFTVVASAEETNIALPAGDEEPDPAITPLPTADNLKIVTVSTSATVYTPPDVLISTAEAVEGQPLTFNVDLTSQSPTAIQLDLATTGGTATDGVDYENTTFEYSVDGGTTWLAATGTNGTIVTIPANTDGILVRIDTITDEADEADETMQLSVGSVVSEPSDVGSTSDTGIGTIIDDDLTILNFSLLANTNQKIQFVQLTFTDTQPNGQGQIDTFSTVVALDAEGNQATLFNFAIDVGFEINPEHTFMVTLQYLGNDNPGAGSDHVIIREFVVEGVEIIDHNNIQLGTSKSDGIYAQIMPIDHTDPVVGTEYDFVPSATGTTGNDLIDQSATTGGVTIDGAEGNDLLIGGSGDDTIYGGEDTDILVGGPGNDTLDGEDTTGIDTADYSTDPDGITADLSAAGPNVTDGYGGHDTLINIENVVGSNSGGDNLTGDGERNFLSGLGGNDTIDGGGGDDILSGGLGNDTIMGGTGDDEIYGGEGDDLLVGGAGSDILAGGKNADTFKYGDIAEGGDTITDFKLADNDVLDIGDVLSGYDSGDDLSQWVQLDTTTSPGDTLVMVNPNGTGDPGDYELLATLQGTTINDTVDDLVASGNLDVGI